MWPQAQRPGEVLRWRGTFPTKGLSWKAESQFSGLRTFGAQWDSHCVWLHLIGLPWISLVHFGVFKNVAFGAKAGGTRLRSQFLLGNKTQTEKSAGERQEGWCDGWEPCSQDTSGFEPQHPLCIVVRIPSLCFLIRKRGGHISTAHHEGRDD